MGVCKSCGKSFADGAKFCPSCGATFVSKEQVTNEENISEMKTEGQLEKKKKTFFKTPLFIGLAILLLGGGVLGAALIMNKSPMESYLLSEYKTYEKAMKETKEQYGEKLDFQEKKLEQPSTSKYDLTTDLEIDSFAGDPRLEIIREMLNESGIFMEINDDPKNKESQMKIGLNMEGTPLIEAAMYQSDEKMGLSVPAIYDTFFYLNAKDYGEFMRMVDPAYEGPEEYNMNQFNFSYGDLILSEKEKEYLIETYAKLLYDNLEEDYFSEKKNVEFEHKGVEMKLHELTFKMSPKETGQLLTKLVDQMIKDKELQNMYVKRAKLLNVSLFAEEEIIDEDDMKDEFVTSLKEIKESLKDEEFPVGFTSKILVDEDDYIINREIKLTEDDEDLVVNYTDIMDGDEKRYQDVTIKTSDASEYVSLQIINDITYKKDGRIEDMKVEFSEADEEEVLSFAMKSEFDGKNANKQEVVRTFSMDFTSDEGPTTLGGTIKQSNDVSAEENYSKNQYAIELELKDEYDSKFILNIENEQKIEEKLEMPDLTDGAPGATNVVDLTEEKIMEAYPEVMMNLMAIGEAFGLDPYDVAINFDPYNYYYKNIYYNNYFNDDSYYDGESFEAYEDESVDELGEGAADL